MLPLLQQNLDELQQRDRAVDPKNHFKFKELQEKIKATVSTGDTIVKFSVWFRKNRYPAFCLIITMNS